MESRPRVARVQVKRAAAKRVAVRRAPMRETVDVKAQVEAGPMERPLRPGQCRAHMRKVLAAEFRDIVKGFVEGAKSGSCQHMKLATELLEPRKREPARPRRGGTLKRLIRRMEQIDE